MVTPSILFVALGGLGVFLIGVSKTGFGGGGGSLAVLLMALVVSARESVATLLPILCVADLFSIWIYRGRWDFRLVKILAPGTLIGIGVGVMLLGLASDLYLKKALGLIAVAFVILQLSRSRFGVQRGQYSPRPLLGALFGGAAGALSTLAHAADPVIAIFLLSTGISKEVYVATAVLYFAILNYLKVIPYVLTGILNLDALISGLALLPFVPLGTYAGFFLNRRIPSRHFTTFIYSLLFVTGCYFLAGADIAGLLAGLPPKP